MYELCHHVMSSYSANQQNRLMLEKQTRQTYLILILPVHISITDAGHIVNLLNKLTCLHHCQPDVIQIMVNIHHG